MEDLRTILIDLQSKLKALVDRIPLGEAPSPMTFSSISDPGESENVTRGQPQSPSPHALKLPGGGPNGCSEQYHSKVLIAFHKWARVILLLFIDKVGICFSSPIYCDGHPPFYPPYTDTPLEGLLRSLPTISKEC